ncbi:hypothetical protein [Chroococcidiopsis sp. CCMEE 29]|nr:hypothetical protein [Chroococcidiopsis sp. CCMEE 29]
MRSNTAFEDEIVGHALHKVWVDKSNILLKRTWSHEPYIFAF